VAIYILSMPNETISTANKDVQILVPGRTINRIRNLQPKIGALLGLRSKAPQYKVMDEALDLLEKKVGK
jgi:hypothetical protein